VKIEVQEGYPELEVIIRCPEATDEVREIAALLQGAGNHDKLIGLKDGATHIISPQEVYYCDTVDKRYFIYTERDVFETHQKLYELERLLAGGDFFRSSKSQIVNIARIASLCPDFNGRLEVVMKNGERVIVSRQYAKALKERLGLK